MLREIITPTSENYNLHIPREYINHKVEILILPLDNEKEEPKPFSDEILLRDTSGIIKEVGLDPVEWQRKIRSKWDDRI